METPLTPSVSQHEEHEEEEVSEGQIEKMFVQERAEFRRLLIDGQLSKRTAHSVLASGKLPGIIAAAIIKLAQTLTGLFRGLVDYDRNRTELLEACHFDSKYIDVPIEQWPVNRRGKRQVEIREEHLGRIKTLAEIDADCAPDEEDADPIAVLEIFGRQNQGRQQEHLLVTFFTARGLRFCLILFEGVNGERRCNVNRVLPQNDFGPDYRVLRVRKSKR